MRTLRLALIALGLACVGASSYAQSAVTATCKDGTTFNGASRRGACSRHGGVQAYGDANTAAPATVGTAAGTGTVANPLGPTSPAPVSPAPTAQANPVAPSRPAPSQPYTRATPSTLGGGSGQVWVNSTSKVYHCQGDRHYGKTKSGSYMTEAAAKADGDRPSRGRTCS